jgi:hypothetical protein
MRLAAIIFRVLIFIFYSFTGYGWDTGKPIARYWSDDLWFVPLAGFTGLPQALQPGAWSATRTPNVPATEPAGSEIFMSFIGLFFGGCGLPFVVQRSAGK